MISLRNLYLICSIAGVANVRRLTLAFLMDLLISNVDFFLFMNLYSKAYLGGLIKTDPIFLLSF